MEARTQRKEILGILDISGASLNRMIKENGFPKPEKIGNAHYFSTVAVYEHLSHLAGRPIEIGDKLNSSKTLSKRFGKSDSWTWYTFQKNKARKSKAIVQRSRLFWFESDIQADAVLVTYLEIAKEVTT